jgi:hypothetical protein
MGVEVGTGVEVDVLVAAAAVSAADVAASSSGEGPQADNKMQNNIRTNPILNFFVKFMIDLL